MSVERSNDQAALRLCGIGVSYGGVAVLEDVSADMPAGALTAIVGPNGAGKSTLLKAALGVVKKSAGSALFFGEPLEKARAKVAYMPQRASVDWDFPIRVIDVVLMGMQRQLGLLRRVSPAQKVHAASCLERVGMAEFAARQIGALSGGQQQRVFLARALAQGAQLYLLDEPFAGVDAASEKAIVKVLQSLRDEGAAVVVVHHDLASVPAWFDRVLLLNRRVMAAGPVDDAFTPETLARTYGHVLPPALVA